MPNLLIGGTGLITPVGLGQLQTYSSVDAAINRYQESDITGALNTPVRMALVPPELLNAAVNTQSLTASLSHRQKRLLKLATIALSDIKDSLPKQPLPLFIAGPESTDGENDINRAFIENLASQSAVEFDQTLCRTTNIGRAGVFDMMELANRYFDVSDSPYVLIGGVDTYYHMPTLSQLNKDKRLLLPNSVDGFVGGEAAGFILLISPKAPDDIKQQAIAQISQPVSINTYGVKPSPTSLWGDTLSSAFRQTFNVMNVPISDIYSSQNGESKWAKELAIAMMRTKKSFTEQTNIIKPAQSYGDIGAANGSVLLALAIEKSQQQNANKPIMIYSSSDSGSRGALCVTTNMEKTALFTDNTKHKELV